MLISVICCVTGSAAAAPMGDSASLAELFKLASMIWIADASEVGLLVTLLEPEKQQNQRWLNHSIDHHGINTWGRKEWVSDRRSTSTQLHIQEFLRQMNEWKDTRRRLRKALLTHVTERTHTSTILSGDMLLITHRTHAISPGVPVEPTASGAEHGHGALVGLLGHRSVWEHTHTKTEHWSVQCNDLNLLFFPPKSIYRTFKADAQHTENMRNKNPAKERKEGIWKKLKLPERKKRVNKRFCTLSVIKERDCSALYWNSHDLETCKYRRRDVLSLKGSGWNTSWGVSQQAWQQTPPPSRTHTHTRV